MSEDKKIKIEDTRSMIRNLTGQILIAAGIAVILYVGYYSNTFADKNIMSIALGFGCFLTMAGVVWLFVQLQREEKKAVDEPMYKKGASLEQVMPQLDKNYRVLRKQTTQGFMIAGIFMAVGLLIIAVGSVGELFGLTSTGVNLTTIAGILTEFISGTALVIYKMNFDRLNSISDDLLSTWKVLTAFEKAGLSGDREESDLDDYQKSILAVLVTTLVQGPPREHAEAPYPSSVARTRE